MGLGYPAKVADRSKWREDFDHSPRRGVRFETMSGLPLEPVYGPDGAELPGQYPYTRGPYASMYRSRLWTMRQFAGFGSAEDTNHRFKELLRAGGDGLSTAFDMPTLLGRDSDDLLAKGEVGRAGVAVDRPGPPARRSSLTRPFVSSAEPKPANWRIVHRRERYMDAYGPRV